MNWFLYERDLRYKRVKEHFQVTGPISIDITVTISEFSELLSHQSLGN